MEEKTFMCIAAEIQENEKDEALAIISYTKLLENVIISDLEETKRQKIISTITEIISDELNHQKKLHELYTYLTGIETNKN